eukprot:1014903-Pelagomonas_calceolata.AAC.3
MRNEPLGLPTSGKVHIWLPWPALRIPRPGTRHACQIQQEADVSQNPAWPPHAHGTAPDGSLRILMPTELLGPGPGSGLADKILWLVRMIPAR